MADCKFSPPLFSCAAKLESCAWYEVVKILVLQDKMFSCIKLNHQNHPKHLKHLFSVRFWTKNRPFFGPYRKWKQVCVSGETLVWKLRSEEVIAPA
ncbi:MAG: hypothetical protein Q4E41_05660, partial [Bacteroidales bacterium]|nr:hypothetical protein [Bacteroidales bacterium]